MKPLLLSSLSILLLLTGCATSYGPRGITGGYSQTRIQDDIFTIVSDGNAYTHKSKVEYHALVRAAEITIQQGRTYFAILGSDLDIKTTQMFIPGQTFVNTNSSGSAYAQPSVNPYMPAKVNYYGNSYSTISSTPGFASSLQKPIVTLTIQTLPKRIEPCLDARQLLSGALEKRIKLSNETKTILGIQPQKKV